MQHHLLIDCTEILKRCQRPLLNLNLESRKRKKYYIEIIKMMTTEMMSSAANAYCVWCVAPSPSATVARAKRRSRLKSWQRPLPNVVNIGGIAWNSNIDGNDQLVGAVALEWDGAPKVIWGRSLGGGSGIT